MSRQIAKFFVAERTRSKMSVLSGDYSSLQKEVPASVLPTWLGGTNVLDGNKGGPLPLDALPAAKQEPKQQKKKKQPKKKK